MHGVTGPRRLAMLELRLASEPPQGSTGMTNLWGESHLKDEVALHSDRSSGSPEPTIHRFPGMSLSDDHRPGEASRTHARTRFSRSDSPAPAGPK